MSGPNGNSGVGRLVTADYQKPNFKLNLFQGTSGSYAGLDRFGRTKNQFWDGYTDGTSTNDVDRFVYDYDRADNPKYRDIDAAIYTSNNKDQAYTFDNRHRLVTFNRGSVTSGTISDASANWNQQWTLDKMGNWGTFKWDSDGGANSFTTQSRSHNDVNEIDTDNDHSNSVGTSITGSGADWIDPKYDAAGNMIEGPKPGSGTTRNQYVYDAWNRLVKVTNNSNQLVSVHEYDGLNRRIRREIYTTPGTLDYTLHYYYNEAHQELEVRKETGGTELANPLEQYVWHEYYIDAVATRYYDSDPTNDTGVQEQYFTHDANFNVTAVTDSSGTVLERYEYDAYGNVTFLTNSFGQDSDQKSDSANPHTYTGRQFEPESGLYYYRARFYDSGLGRFVSRDPIEYNTKDLNLYSYVGNRPNVFVDPSGEQWYWPKGSGVPKTPKNFVPPTNPPQPPMPPQNVPKGWGVKIMQPTTEYPDGYWVLEKPMPQGKPQPINPSTMKPGPKPDCHVPLPPMKDLTFQQLVKQFGSKKAACK